MKRYLTSGIVLLVLCVTLIACFTYNRGNRVRYDKNSYAGYTYAIIKDSHQTSIVIGVPATIDEEGLRKTLTKAADEHQSYSERDYMFYKHLWVEAYLTDGNRQSKVPAGKLRRYVPPINGKEGEDIFDFIIAIALSKNDYFKITLQEARSSIGF